MLARAGVGVWARMAPGSFLSKVPIAFAPPHDPHPEVQGVHSFPQLPPLEMGLYCVHARDLDPSPGTESIPHHLWDGVGPPNNGPQAPPRFPPAPATAAVCPKSEDNRRVSLYFLWWTLLFSVSRYT